MLLNNDNNHSNDKNSNDKIVVVIIITIPKNNNNRNSNDKNSSRNNNNNNRKDSNFRPSHVWRVSDPACSATPSCPETGPNTDSLVPTSQATKRTSNMLPALIPLGFRV